MRSIDLEKDSERSIVLRLAFPAMLGQLINVLYSIIDRMYIGNIKDIGKLGLGAIGICAPITTLIISISYLVGTGAAPLMMMNLGAKNQKKANVIFSNAVILLIFFGIIISLIMLIFLEPLLKIFGATDTLMPYSLSYMRIYLIGAAFAIISTGFNQFIVAEGFSNIGMKSMIIGAVVNIILDPIFIFKANLGVAGAAIATIIAIFCSFLYSLFFIIGKKNKVKFLFKGFNLKDCLTILKLGLSPFVIMASDSIVIICLNSSIKHYVTNNVETYLSVVTIATSFFQLMTMPLLGISSGTSGVLSYNYGAMDIERVKKAEGYILKLALIFTSFCFVISFFLAKYFCRIFTNDIDLINISIKAIKIYTFGIIILSFQYVFVDGLTALGCPNWASFLSLTRKTLIITLTWTLPIIMSNMGFFYAELIGDLVSSSITFITFLVVFPKILNRKRCA